MKKIKNIFLNATEKKFVKQTIIHSKKDDDTIALTVSRDYRYLLLFSEISKKSNRKIFLLTPTIYFPKASHLFLIIPYFIRKIYDNLIEKKWIKLYSAISNNIVVIKPKYGYYESIKLFKHSFKIWRSLLIKEDLIKLEYNESKLDILYTTIILGLLISQQ